MFDSADTYILDGTVPVACPDSFKWAEWRADFKKSIVQKTFLLDKKRDLVEVSTVFLGTAWSGSNPPILFETLVRGGTHNGLGSRYRTWTESEQGHQAMVDKLIMVYDHLILDKETEE